MIDGSGNDPTPTQKNGDGCRVFYITDDNPATHNKVEIHHLTIKGGDARGDGGGILSWEQLVLSNCEVSGNYSGGSGGGIAVRGYSNINYLIQADTIWVLNNIARFGGGGIFLGQGGCQFFTSFVRGNTARLGGGYYIAAESSLSTNGGECSSNKAVLSAFSSDDLFSAGGGLYCSGWTSIFKTEIRSNTATQTGGYGGAIYITGANAFRLSSAKVIGNQARQGGAIANYSNLFVADTCQFDSNRAVRPLRGTQSRWGHFPWLVFSGVRDLQFHLE